MAVIEQRLMDVYMALGEGTQSTDATLLGKIRKLIRMARSIKSAAA